MKKKSRIKTFWEGNPKDLLYTNKQISTDMMKLHLNCFWNSAWVPTGLRKAIRKRNIPSAPGGTGNHGYLETSPWDKRAKLMSSK